MSESIQLALINLASNIVLWGGNIALAFLAIWRLRVTMRDENSRQTAEIKPILQHEITPAVAELKEAIVNGHDQIKPILEKEIKPAVAEIKKAIVKNGAHPK